MIRHLYLRWMRFRGKHVIAEDCWCNPVILSPDGKVIKGS